jgi:prefoldin subunit 5
VNALLSAKEILKIICLAAVAFCLISVSIVVHKYLDISARSIKDASIHLDGMVGEARLATKKSVSATADTDEAMKNLNETITDLDRLIWKFDDTADAATQGVNSISSRSSQAIEAATSTIKRLGVVADATTTRIDSLSETQARADRAIDAIETVPNHVNGALDALKPLEQSLTWTTAKLGDYIQGPLATATNNSGMMIKHVDDRFFKPWDGTHPFKHYIGIGINLIQPTAGAVALAKGN